MMPLSRIYDVTVLSCLKVRVRAKSKADARAKAWRELSNPTAPVKYDLYSRAGFGPPK